MFDWNTSTPEAVARLVAERRAAGLIQMEVANNDRAVREARRQTAAALRGPGGRRWMNKNLRPDGLHYELQANEDLDLEIGTEPGTEVPGHTKMNRRANEWFPTYARVFVRRISTGQVLAHYETRDGLNHVGESTFAWEDLNETVLAAIEEATR